MLEKHPVVSAPFHPGTPWGLFRFETPEAAAPAAVADPPADPGATDPEAGAAGGAEPSAAAPAPAAPAWGPDSPEFLAAVDQVIAARYGAPQQDYGDDPQPAGGFELDLFADDAGEQIAGLFGQMLTQALDQRLGPIQRSHEEQQIAQGRAESLETFKSFEDLGEFDHDKAFAQAQEIFTGYVQQFGPQYAQQFTGRALRQAAEQQARYEREIETRGIERYKAELQKAAGGGPQEPGVGGGAVRPTEQGHSYDEVIARWNARGQAGGAQI